MTAPRVLVICCEGYQDRAFWAGWLEHLKWLDPREQPGKTPRTTIQEPWSPGKPITGGIFRFDAPSTQMVALVVPCQGDEKVLRRAEGYLKERSQRPVADLIINVDVDTDAAEPIERSVDSFRQSLRTRLARLNTPVHEEQDGSFRVGAADDTTRVHPVLWHARGPTGPGVPAKQTLERLVCAALADVHPVRAALLDAWLSPRPEGPLQGHKEHALSYMAGWYAEHGNEDFYRHVWRDPDVARVLESRLRAGDGWRWISSLPAM